MVRLPADVRDRILHHAREGHPLEICGVLAGRRDGPTRDVLHAFPATNVHPNPRTEYLIDPQEQLEILLRVEDELDLEVLGFYHSHPEGAAELSATDEARATWPDSVYLLVWWPGGEREGVGAWTWQPQAGGFVEAGLDVQGKADR